MRLVRSLNQVIDWRGKPKRIGCDNGPQYIIGLRATWTEKKLLSWYLFSQETHRQIAYIERYNLTLRYDWLGHYLFSSIKNVQANATRWLWTYNNERPNMRPDGITREQTLALAV